MKKLLSLFVAVVASFTFHQSAYCQGAVYFGSLSNQVSIGVSKIHDFRQDITFSIMQMTKSKNFDAFTISGVDKDGNDIKFNLKEDTVYHMQMDKKLYAHQKDYTINRMDYLRLQRLLNDTQSTVYINGLECNGVAFVSILTSLQNSPVNFSPEGIRFGAGRMWGMPQGNMVFMRYRDDNGKRRDMFVRFHDRIRQQNNK